MNKKLLEVLRCPKSHNSLRLLIENSDGDDIQSGWLVSCDGTHRYAIAGGVPRFVSGVNYADSFGMQWNRFSRTQLDSCSGHPISADRFWNSTGWTPSALKGKWVLVMVNDPPAPSDEPTLFGGPALTYYGRWTYKYEQALRKGALGVLIIHTTPTASYGWDVVRSSWGREDQEVALGIGAIQLVLRHIVNQSISVLRGRHHRQAFGSFWGAYQLCDIAWDRTFTRHVTKQRPHRAQLPSDRYRIEVALIQVA